MTTVAFHMEGSRIVSVDVRGHSGFAEEGADLAAIEQAIKTMPNYFAEVSAAMRKRLLQVWSKNRMRLMGNSSNI